MNTQEPTAISSGTFDSFLSQWMAPFMFSIICVVLIMTITLVTKMKYSRTVQLTKLSMFPYYVIIMYLFFEAGEILLIILIFNQLEIRFERDVSYFNSSVVWPLIGTFSIAKFVSYTLFVNSQVFEWFITYFFMRFQKDLKLEYLQVKRSNYQTIERKFYKVFKIQTYLTVFLYSAYIAINWYYYFYLTSPKND